MKVNFSKILTDLDGKELRNGEDIVTLKQVCVNALMAPLKNEEPSGEEKARRFHLALGIHAAVEPLEMTPEDLTVIRGLVGKVYSALVVGRAFELLT